MRRTCSTALAAALLLSTMLGSSVGHAQGKSIVVGMNQEPDRLYKSTMLVATLVKNLIFDQLVQTDDRMQVFAQLAADIPTIENGLATFTGSGGDRRLEVTMPLRQGVTWNDGTPFTADDVVYMFGVINNPESGWATDMEEKIKSIDKIDDFTVKFTYLSSNEAKAKDPDVYKNQGNDPVIDPLYFFGEGIDESFVYPRHKLRELIGDDPMHSKDITKVDNSDLARNPVGTGPYVVSSWDSGVNLTLSSRGLALPQRLGRPNIDTVVFTFIPTKDTLKAALEAGEVQVATQDAVGVDDSVDLDRMAGIQAQYVQGTTWEHLTLNLNNEILSDARVRKALAYGVDRKELSDVIMYGKTEPAASQIPSWSWAFNGDVPKYDYNPGLADELLVQAGWTRSAADGVRTKSGKRLSLKFWSTPSNIRPRQLPLIKDQLAKIGVEMNVDFVAAKVFFDAKASSPQALSARQFDVAEFAWVGGYDPGADSSYTNHSKNIPSKANNYKGGNYSGFTHQRNDQLMEQGMGSLDPNFRRNVYAEAQQIWMSELPIIPIYLRPITVAATTRLVNLRTSMSSSGETWNVEQWDLTS